MLENGNKLLVAHRRLFQSEQPRYFLGEVIAYEAGLAKVRGFTFVRDVMESFFIRKDDLRTKFISLTSAATIVYQLPDDTDVAAARFQFEDSELTLNDGKNLKMNMTEGAHQGHI